MMLSAYAIDLRLSAHYKNIYQVETLQHRPLLTKMSKFEQELLIFSFFVIYCNNQHVNTLCKLFTTRMPALIEQVSLSEVGCESSVFMYIC